MAIQSLQNLHKFILPQPRWYVKECLPAIFPYNIIENSLTSLTYDSAFVGPNNFRSGTKTAYCMYGLVGHIKIWSKLIIICMIMFLMTSYANKMTTNCFTNSFTLCLKTNQQHRGALGKTYRPKLICCYRPDRNLRIISLYLSDINQ